ncbi:MAG: Protein phosphatase PrpC [Elusimicrobia bacterium]|nr:Protein phosphatase PrpC [Elusimicrobiota bacterium]
MGNRLNIYGKTDKGRRRSNNEDSFFVEPDLGFMIVADGMGGHASGEVASQLATTLCSEQLKRALKTGHVPVFFHVPNNPNLDPRTRLLGDSVKFSNQAVYEAAQTNPENHNMGTTLVAALWLDEKLAVANVGDSRLYLVHKGKLQLCTNDHSFIQEQIDKGLLTPEDAEKSDLRNMLTRSIGINDDVEVDLKEIPVDEGDYILLCSDGLTKMLDNSQIESVFTSESDPKNISEKLIELANNAGGGDNITVIVAQLEPRSNWGSLADRVKSVFSRATGN